MTERTSVSQPVIENSATSEESTTDMRRQPAMSSSIDLLWAHQLHREQSALFSRVIDLESTLSATLASRNEPITAKLEEFKAQICSLRSELGDMRRDIDTQTEKGPKSGEERWKFEFDANLKQEIEKNCMRITDIVHQKIECLKSELLDIIETAGAKYKLKNQTLNDRISSLGPFQPSDPQPAQNKLFTNPLPPPEGYPRMRYPTNITSKSAVCSIPTDLASEVPLAGSPGTKESHRNKRHKYRAAHDLAILHNISNGQSEIGQTEQNHSPSEEHNEVGTEKAVPYLKRPAADRPTTNNVTQKNFIEAPRNAKIPKIGRNDSGANIDKIDNSRRTRRRRIIPVVWPVDIEGGSA